MLLIYYNPNLEKFYTKYEVYTLKKVGFKNSYGHELMQILYFDNKSIYSIDSSYDIKYDRKNKHRFLKRLIRFLNKFVE